MKTVLFLCTGNSCRSQMAEGFMRNLGQDKFKAFSAGTRPTAINPLTGVVMAELGIDISKQRSKSVNEFLGEQFDYVITVCDQAMQDCPVFPGKYQARRWSLADPAMHEDSCEGIIIFRKIRDQIQSNIKAFLEKEESI